MSVALMEDRPAYISFKQVAVEDRTASIEKGHYVSRDVDYVFVTPHGSKDVLEDEALNWLDKQKEHARTGRIPDEHYRYFERSYNNYKEGLELPVDGTPIKTWPVLSPSQVETLLFLKIRTVEDLAVANEDTISMIGMGGRALKQKAEAWILSSKDNGQAASKITSLQSELSDAKDSIKKYEDVIRELSDRIDTLESKPSIAASSKK